MRKPILFATLAAASLWASSALPCGGPFGAGFTVDPSQKIVVKHDAGVETYIFRPHFCGQASQFGLVLPIPDQLTANPELAEAKLFDELDAFTAPAVVKQTKCAGDYDTDAGAYDAGSNGGEGGVDVINAGQVGIFDWVLVKADTTTAFTDWLDANSFPHDPTAESAFSYYVQKSWYFVAFKVTASNTAPPAGSRLCGDLGPLSLSFSAVEAVVPARIAAVDTAQLYAYAWEVFGISNSVMSAVNQNVSPILRFAGSFPNGQTAQYPELSKLAAPGNKVTKLLLAFYGSSIDADITLTPSPSQADYRDTVYETTYVDCDAGTGGSAGQAGTGGGGGSAGQPIDADAGATGGTGGTDEVVTPPTPDDSGCSVAGGGSSRFASFGALAALFAGWLSARRRRR